MSPVVQVQTEPLAPENSLMAIIARAASDPTVDIDKFERLMQLSERAAATTSLAAYNAALAELQPELPVIGERGGIKDRTGKVQSTYALWEDINEAIRPILGRHGFSLSFRVHVDNGERIEVTGVLAHRAGHSEQTSMSLPLDTSGSKNAVQSVGSSTSYGKRYTAGALLNLTSRGEDDDGRAGGAAPTLTQDQVDIIKAKIAEVGADEARFLAVGKIERVEDMLAKDFDGAMAMLAKKAKARTDV